MAHQTFAVLGGCVEESHGR